MTNPWELVYPPTPMTPLPPPWQISSTSRWIRSDPWLAATLLFAIAAAIYPLWISPLLPMMDLPQHLATVRILHSYQDPWYAVAKYHVLDFSKTQYLSWYLSVDALAYLMPLETANRLVLSLYAAGLPLSMLALLRAHGRDPALALLAAPLVYNVFFFMGFANYITALPLMLWGLALLQRCLNAPNWPRVAGLSALALVLFYSHAQAFALYGLLAGLTVLLGAPGWHPRHWWKAALHMAPALLAMAVWTSRSLILAGEADWKQGHGGRNATSAKMNFEPLQERLHHLGDWWTDVYQGDSDEKLALAWLAVLLLALMLRRPVTQASHPHFTWARLKLPGLLLVATLAVYLLSPVSYKWIWPISYRFVPVVALLSVLAAAGEDWLGATPTQRQWTRRLGVLLPALLLMLFAARLHGEKALAFSAEAGPIREIVARAEPGKKLISLVYGSGSAVLQQAPMIHLGQYYVVDRGGQASFSFADFPQSPVLYPSVDGPPKFPARFEWTPERFTWAEHGYWFDYVLVRGGGDPLARDADKVELVAEMPPYRLYRNKALVQSPPQR